MDGIYVGALVEGGEIIEGLGDRILGRVALEDVVHPHTGEVIVRANEEIDEGLVAKIGSVLSSPLGARVAPAGPVSEHRSRVSAFRST